MADTVINTSKERTAMFAARLREIAAKQSHARETGAARPEPVDT